VNNFWEKLTPREQWLAISVGALLTVSILFLIGYRCAIRVMDLNASVNALEDRLISCYELDARTISVERAYKDVAAQHSSEWTEAEIHNRLRDEIYRLQLEDPDAGPEQAKKLVEIPSLRQGTLKDTGAGYREYQLTIRIPSTDIASLLIFLCRLQQSQQALRIDSLEIARPPESPLVMGNIVVTRTVVDRKPEDDAETEASPEQPVASSTFEATWSGGAVEDWKGDGFDLSLAPQMGDLTSPGGECLKAEAKAEQAAVGMTRELEAGVVYRLSLDVCSSAPCVLRVEHDSDGSAFDGEQKLAGDGKLHRYQILFTVDGEMGAKVGVRVPMIRMEKSGAILYVDNVALVQQAE
jgi:type II secretory pathway component PulM